MKDCAEEFDVIVVGAGISGGLPAVIKAGMAAPCKKARTRAPPAAQIRLKLSSAEKSNDLCLLPPRHQRRDELLPAEMWGRISRLNAEFCDPMSGIEVP